MVHLALAGLDESDQVRHVVPDVSSDPDCSHFPSLSERPPRVLVLSMHNEPAYARVALGAGATGYLVKSVSEDLLLSAIRSVRRGQAVIDLDDDARTAKVFGPDGPQAVRGPTRATIGLSVREREVLRLLGQGHTNVAIADQLHLSPKTVSTYRARIAEKLGLQSTADFVRYATDTGLLEN